MGAMNTYPTAEPIPNDWPAIPCSRAGCIHPAVWFSRVPGLPADAVMSSCDDHLNTMAGALHKLIGPADDR